MLISGIGRIFSTATGIVDFNKGKSEDDGSSILIGRVTDVCLNTNSELYNSWNSIGIISYQELKTNTPTSNQNKLSPSKAYPLFSNDKFYPLVDEFVIIFKGASPNNPQTSNIKQNYYIPLNIWNTQHYNGFPSSFDTPPESQNTNYLDILSNNPFVAGKYEEELPLNGKSGGNFVEKGNIHPILPFAGDKIVEGRNGNSIRFGSTATTDGEIKNNWSEGSDEGEPIVIIKNGQPSGSSSEGFIPITEDINQDPSSIYLTSKQQIPIQVSTNPPAAGERSTIPFGGLVNKTPISPKSFNNSQVMLASNRILFNTVGDSILMSADKNIILESNEDIGIRSTKSNINIIAPKGNISIGERNAQEAVIKGTSFNVQLDSLLKNIEILCDALLTEASLVSTPGAAQALKLVATEFKDNLATLLSDKVKIS